MELALTIVSYVVVAVLGAFLWTKVSPLVQKWLSAHKAKSAVANAQKLLAAEAAHAAAVQAAHATVTAAAATSAVPTVVVNPATGTPVVHS